MANTAFNFNTPITPPDATRDIANKMAGLSFQEGSTTGNSNANNSTPDSTDVEMLDIDDFVEQTRQTQGKGFRIGMTNDNSAGVISGSASRRGDSHPTDEDNDVIMIDIDDTLKATNAEAPKMLLSELTDVKVFTSDGERTLPSLLAANAQTPPAWMLSILQSDRLPSLKNLKTITVQADKIELSF